MSRITVNEAQVRGLWEQIWYSNNGFYNGIEPGVRAKLNELHLSLLDEARQRAYGITLPPGDSTNLVKPEVVPPVSGPTEIPAIHDPVRYSFNGRRLWIPWAQDMPSGVRRGSRRLGYPEGAVIHWTAGHRNGLKSGGEFQRSSGMNYFILDKDGNLGQGDPLNLWGYHAGASSWRGIPGTVSDELVGFELQAAGNLRKNGDDFYPWWDQGRNLPQNRIPASEAVYSAKRGNIAAGWYHRYTDAQQITLRAALCWLHLNHPGVFKIQFILGHDEVSPGRKTDPGAALVKADGTPMTMPEFRDQIADDVRIILSNR